MKLWQPYIMWSNKVFIPVKVGVVHVTVPRGIRVLEARVDRGHRTRFRAADGRIVVRDLLRSFIVLGHWPAAETTADTVEKALHHRGSTYDARGYRYTNRNCRRAVSRRTRMRPAETNVMCCYVFTIDVLFFFFFR